MSAKSRRWFLPHSPDVLGMLSQQADVTVDGIDAFAAWAEGDHASGNKVREAEHRADLEKGTLIAAVREAFMTPLDPEDLFELSRELDEVMNAAKNTVREADAMSLTPDEAVSHMAKAVAEGVHHLRTAIGHLSHDGDTATTEAHHAIKAQRRLERLYRVAMSERVGAGELRDVIGYLELYRRLSSISDSIIRVADRIEYAIVKEA
jgi:uncharacterized protein Yka (UPF0111/DUF47 family)